MCKVQFDGSGDEDQGIAALLTASFVHRQHGLDATVPVALCVPNDHFRHITA